MRVWQLSVTGGGQWVQVRAIEGYSTFILAYLGVFTGPAGVGDWGWIPYVVSACLNP